MGQVELLGGEPNGCPIVQNGPAVKAAALAHAEETSRVASGDSLVLLLGYGGLACIVAFVAEETLGPNQFAYPKELLLHALALATAYVLVRKARRFELDQTDLFLLAFISLSTVSAAFAATNPWLSVRVLGVSVSGAAVFWAGRSLAASGRAGDVTYIIAFITTAAAVTGLLEAHGLLELSPQGRSPGGAMGNRNRLAHLLVLGLPSIWALAFTARRKSHMAALLAASVAVVAVLTLTRCRAAWLAMAITVPLIILSGIYLTRRGSVHLPAQRVGAIAAAVVLGMVFAVAVPTQLSWSSSHPFRSTLERLVDYRSGSGYGRLVQWEATARMAWDNRWIGVGPGNWSVRYSSYVVPNDPSFSDLSGLPTNGLPHGDWLAVAAERGFGALLMLIGFFTALIWSGFKSAREGTDGRAGLTIMVGVATLVTLGITATFDPVLSTPAPTLLVFMVFGTLLPRRHPLLAFPVTGRAGFLIKAHILIVLAIPAINSARQLGAGLIYANSRSVESLTRAVNVYPGDFRAHLRLGEAWVGLGHCEKALPHLQRAHELFPSASIPVHLRAECSRIPRGVEPTLQVGRS